MNTIIITGGTIDEVFIEEYLNSNKFDVIIAADKGLEVINRLNVTPNYIIGDFDSIDIGVLKQYENTNIPITYLKPEKDYTDTHMALKKAIEIGSDSITILGAIGTRLDHTLANIHILKEALDNNIEARIINENNEIMLINNEITINKNSEFKYISLLPFTTKVLGITLEGFKYLLNDATLNIGESIGVSNEQIADHARIKIKEGIAILIFSKD